MSNVIQFLEAMGKDAALSRLSDEALATQIAQWEIGATLRPALAARDHQALNRLLNGRDNVVCGLFTPEEEAPTEPLPEDDAPEPEQKVRLVAARR